MRRSRSSGLIALLALVVGGLGGCGGESEPQVQEPAMGQSVTAVAVNQTLLPRIVTASGSVSAWEEVPVGAETGGLVATAVLVDEGGYVRQGQPLVQLNTALLSAQVRQQQAGLETAQATAARDEAALSRAQELESRGFLSRASLDTALANQRSAQAAVAQARAALSQSQTQLAQATIRAPVSGLVISRSVTRGQIVAAGTELFRLVRDGRLELDAQVPETELSLVRAGMPATVTSDQAGETTGTVRIVTPEVDPETRLGIARIALSANGALRPGMFARASIDVGSAPALTIPAAAVIYREGQAGVYVLGDNSTVRFVRIGSGARVGPSLAVTSGLTAGQRVVLSGAGFLGDGDRVRVVQAAPAASAAAATPAATTAIR